jgi:hypothetical protein
MIPLRVVLYTRKDAKLIMFLCYSSFISLTVRSFDEKPMENEILIFDRISCRYGLDLVQIRQKQEESTNCKYSAIYMDFT